MKLVVAALVLCLVGSSFADLSFEFEADVNVSASVTANGWQYRKIDLEAWSTLLGKGVNYISIAVSAKASGSITGDVLVGSAYANVGGHVIGFVGYFLEQADWTLDISSGSSFASFTNITAAAGYIGHGYLSLEETDPSGKVVATAPLKFVAIPSNNNGLSWGITDHSTLSADLQYVVFSGSGTTGFSVDIAFIAATHAGILNVTNTPVGPKTFESVIRILNWPYKNASNSLNLIIGVATGQTSLSSSGQSIISANGSNQVFFSVAKEVQVETGLAKAGIHITANDTTNIEDESFFAQVEAKYGGASTYHTVRITFPPGSENIVYDPSVGAGTPMDDGSSQNGSSSPASAAAPVAMLALLLALACIFL